MTQASGFEALLAAAKRLSEKSASDPALLERIRKNPGQTIAEEAGQPLPKGVLIKVEPGADGKSFALFPHIDPGMSGELDDRMLEVVAGGGKVSQQNPITFPPPGVGAPKVLR